MFDSARQIVVSVSSFAIRLFPLLTLACILAFPAYKGIGIGYIPVVIGLAGAGCLICLRDRFLMRVTLASDYRLAAVLYVIPAMVQLLLVFMMRPVPAFDGLFVLQHAATLLQTGAMDPMTYYPPAQTWWYASWFAAFGATPLVAQISQIPLCIGIAWVVRRLVLDLRGEAESRIAALMFAWYPSTLGYVLTTPYYHYLYTLTMVFMVWGLCRFLASESASGRCRWMILAGLAAGMGALTKAVQLIAPLQVATWLLVLGCVAAMPLRKWVHGLLIFGTAMLAVLAPWMLRNYHVFDDLVPVCTSGGLVLYSANNPESNGLYSNVPDDVQLASPADMLAHSRWCSDQAKKYMLDHPGHFLSLAVRKFLHTWGSEATFVELINWRGEMRRWIKPLFSAVFVAGWAAMVGLWAAAAWRAMRQKTPLSPYEILAGVLVLSNALVYVVFEGGDRHHLPLVPLIAVLSVVMHIQSKKVTI